MISTLFRSKRRLLVWMGALAVSLCAVGAYAALAPATITFSDITTAAAAGYCISHHLYTTNQTGPYSADGFELVAVPGVVGPCVGIS